MAGVGRAGRRHIDCCRVRRLICELRRREPGNFRRIGSPCWPPQRLYLGRDAPFGAGWLPASDLVNRPATAAVGTDGRGLPTPGGSPARAERRAARPGGGEGAGGGRGGGAARPGGETAGVLRAG